MKKLSILWVFALVFVLSANSLPVDTFDVELTSFELQEELPALDTVLSVADLRVENSLSPGPEVPAATFVAAHYRQSLTLNKSIIVWDKNYNPAILYNITNNSDSSAPMLVSNLPPAPNI